MLEQAKVILKKTGVDRLPSLPHVLLKLLNVLNKENGDFGRLAHFIRQDPALYTRFLYISNLSDSSKTSSQTLEKLLPRIGIDTIKSIINTSAVQQFFSPYSRAKVEFLKQHWQHSILCAELSKLLAEHLNYKNSADAYVCGLTHDIGQLALESAYPEQYTSTFAQLSEDEYFHNLESDEFGTTHQQVGAFLLKDCGINHVITDAVLYHHEETVLILDAHPLVKITNLSNRLSSSYFKIVDTHVFETAEKLFGIPQIKLIELLLSAKVAVSAIASNLEMDFKADGADGETASKIAGDDDLKQVQLAEQVRNIALFESAQKNSVQIINKFDSVKNIELQAGLLFSISNIIVFEYDEKNNQVTALTSNSEPDFLDDLSIPVEPHRSLVTEAIIHQSPQHSFAVNNINKTVIDQQLAGLNDSEGLLCIPIQVNNATAGVLVFGVSAEQQKQLWKQRSLLSRFANTITQSLNITDTSTDTGNDSSDQIAILEKSNREIAHEIRNPLSIINNFLEILRFKLGGGESHQDIDTIKDEIMRIGVILEKLSPPTLPVEKTKAVNINIAIADLTQIFVKSLAHKKAITIGLELDEGMPHIICDINAIKQIYTNLIKNAIEALPTNGQILVYTSSHVNFNGQEFVEIRVTDNGPGIAKALIPRIFSPVQTTKGKNHSGLGLSIVKGLVNDLDGNISCISNKNGTSFHILLPKNYKK